MEERWMASWPSDHGGPGCQEAGRGLYARATGWTGFKALSRSATWSCLLRGKPTGLPGVACGEQFRGASGPARTHFMEGF